MKKHFLAHAFALAVMFNSACLPSEVRAGSNFSSYKNWNDSVISNDKWYLTNSKQASFASNLSRLSSHWHLNPVTALVAISSVGLAAYTLGGLHRKRKRDVSNSKTECAVDGLTLDPIFLSTKYEAIQADKLERLVARNNKLKHDAVKRYEHDIKMLIGEVIAAAKCAQTSTEQKVLSKLMAVDFSGIRNLEQIKPFEKRSLQSIVHYESSTLQKNVATLNDSLCRTEIRLEHDLQQIMEYLEQGAKKGANNLDISLLDVWLFELDRLREKEQMFERVEQ